MKKIGMIGVISNPVKSLSSHNGGWTTVCKSIVEDRFSNTVDILTHIDDWSSYDVLVINEGVNYKPGVYNFFGGVQQVTIDKLIKLSKFKGKVYSINDTVDYNDMIQKRKELKHINFNFKIPGIFELSNSSKKLVLGDSHSISAYKPGYSISRNDGKTLHGFLKKGIVNYLESLTEELVFYAGNIDVRFHVNRLPGPEITVENLCFHLEQQLKDLKLKKISIVGLLPIEDESRKIPGTGKYKGESFYGSRVERQFTVRHFNRCYREMCERNNWDFLEWDFDYDNNSDLSFDHMEARQSVHLRPTSYMFASQFVGNNNNNELKLF